MKTTNIVSGLYLTVAVYLLLKERKNNAAEMQKEKMANLLVEFFEGRDLDNAKKDFYKLMRDNDYSVNHAFEIVLNKGGFRDDGSLHSEL
jgi:hypothetical protein